MTIRRKTTGTGRMRYLRNVPHRFKTKFREDFVSATCSLTRRLDSVHSIRKDEYETWNFGKRRKEQGVLVKEKQDSHAVCEMRSSKLLFSEKPLFCLRLSCCSRKEIEKTIRRKTTGTGRMRHLRNVPRRFKTKPAARVRKLRRLSGERLLELDG